MNLTLRGIVSWSKAHSQKQNSSICLNCEFSSNCSDAISIREKHHLSRTFVSFETTAGPKYFNWKSFVYEPEGRLTALGGCDQNSDTMLPPSRFLEGKATLPGCDSSRGGTRWHPSAASGSEDGGSGDNEFSILSISLIGSDSKSSNRFLPVTFASAMKSGRDPLNRIK